MTERLRCGCVPEYCVHFFFSYPQRFTALVGVSVLYGEAPSPKNPVGRPFRSRYRLAKCVKLLKQLPRK